MPVVIIHVGNLDQAALHVVTLRLRLCATIGNVIAMLDSVASIIEAKGGSAAFALKVNRKPGAVRAWKHRNYFPREAWPEIIQAFPDLNLERLMKLEAETRGAA